MTIPISAVFLKAYWDIDDVISVAGYLLKERNVFRRILGSRYPFIFVDEAQDTFVPIVEGLNELGSGVGLPLVGYFGDPWQQIYDGRAGNFAPPPEGVTITKTENFRCSPQVVILLNAFRTDVEQQPAGKGAVKILNYDPAGKEMIFRVFQPGSVIGEFALIDEHPRSAEARAVGPTEALLINRRDFLPTLKSDPDLAMTLLQTLCRRLRRTNEMLEDLTFLDLGARLAKSLIQLSRQQQGGDHFHEISTIKISQQSLASMVGSTREAVNKKLREWEQIGLISLRRGEVHLL